MNSMYASADTVECIEVEYSETYYNITDTINNLIADREVKSIAISNDPGRTKERLICIVFD